MSFPVVTPSPATLTPLGVAETERDARQRGSDDLARRRPRQGRPNPDARAGDTTSVAVDDAESPKIGTLVNVRA